MRAIDQQETVSQLDDTFFPRRQFLGRLAATSVAAVLWPALADATTELWEEGDPLCGVRYTPLDKPNGYDLDIPFLNSFIGVSETLTGVAPLDRHLSNQYMERYATHPQLTNNLDLLIQAYRKIAPDDTRPTDDVVKQNIVMVQDPALRAGAKQLIYLWYISAFYLPIDLNPDPTKPLQDDPTDTRKKAWVYGTPEQYGRGLVWGVIHAHAPMTPGGPARHWARAPTT